MSELEKRSYAGLKVRAESNGDVLQLSGYAAKFGSKSTDLGGFKETIAPGAFDKSLRGNADVRALKNHDPNYVLGRTKSGTLRLSTDSVGLRFTVDLPPTQYAMDLHTAVKRGDMDQCSFAFKALDDSWDDDDEDRTLRLRTLRAVDLFDISAVVFPAYEDTTIAARSLAAAGVRSNQRVIPATTADKQERIELINLLYNSWQIGVDNDRAHIARLAEINEENRNATLKEIERLQKRIKAGRFSTLESYIEANKNLQALLTAVGKDAPAPQLN
jgi:HK97 family phage prohead protease